jgi:hypothetical protein
MNINTNEPILEIPFSKNEFLDTTLRLKMNGPTSEINYLEMEEVGMEEEGMSQISLKMKRKTITTSTYQVNAENPKTNLENLKDFGINIDDQMTSILISESDLNMQKLVKEKYLSLGVKFERSTWNKWKTFLNKHFQLEFPEFFKDHNDLINKIFMLSNLIAAKTRRGPANFITTSPKIASILAEDPRTQLISTGIYNGPGIRPFAIINDKIKVFIDPTFKFDDETVIIGKNTDEGNTGVVLGEYSRQMMKIEGLSSMDFTLTDKYQLRDRITVSEIGDKDLGYYTTKFVIGKKPFWRRLIRA